MIQIERMMGEQKMQKQELTSIIETLDIGRLIIIPPMLITPLERITTAYYHGPGGGGGDSGGNGSRATKETTLYGSTINFYK